MKKPIGWIIKSVLAKGYKKTSPRTRVAETIERHKGIFSAQDITHALRSLDRVSVYRTLELLASLDIIHPIVHLEGAQYYELHGNTHHHHVVCTRCHRSACIECDVPRIRVRGFQATHHTFIVTALCTSCAKRTRPSRV